MFFLIFITSFFFLSVRNQYLNITVLKIPFSLTVNNTYDYLRLLGVRFELKLKLIIFFMDLLVQLKIVLYSYNINMQVKYNITLQVE